MDVSTVLSVTGICIRVFSAAGAAFPSIVAAPSVVTYGTSTPYTSSVDPQEHSNSSSGLGLLIGLGVGLGLLTTAIFVGAGAFYFRRKYVAQRNNEDYNPDLMHMDDFYGSLNTTELSSSHTTPS